MPDLYRCMDVFVLPSLFEMMPIAVLEAMASGMPVLVNLHANLSWILGEGVRGEGGEKTTDYGRRTTDDGLRTTDHGLQTSDHGLQTTDYGEGRRSESQVSGDGGRAGGICVDMGEDGALARAVRRMTPEIRRALGAAARRRAETVFSKQVVIREYVRYYRQVARRSAEAEGVR
jgi:glycosyltransferase involved in cell wall biosynthesis